MIVGFDDAAAAQRRHGAVVMFGFDDDQFGQALHAFVVRADGCELDANDVKAHVRDHLARFKVPKHVFFLEAAQLPTTATGKVQKFQLVDMAKARLADARSQPSGG